MLYPRFSLRAVCKTFAATAVGVAVLAGPVHAAPDANWTLLDLEEESAPAVVPASSKAAKPEAAKPEAAKPADTRPADKAREQGASSVLERAREAVRAALEKAGETTLQAAPATPAPAAQTAAPAPATQPAAVPVAAPKPVLALTRKDETVRAGVERWATANGWALSWELTQKWPVRFDAQFGDDFLTALEAVCAHFNTQGSEVRAYLYAGNKVLRVVPASTQVVIAEADVTGSEAERARLPHLVQSKGLWLGGPAEAKPAAPVIVKEAAAPQVGVPVPAVQVAKADKPKAESFESHRVAQDRLPALFSASISLTFSNQATLSTVTGLLGTVTGMEVSLPADVDFAVSRLYDAAHPEASAEDAKSGAKAKKKAAKAQDTSAPRIMRTYTGTPKELLDRISLVTGMLWEYQEKTVFFHE